MMRPVIPAGGRFFAVSALCLHFCTGLLWSAAPVAVNDSYVVDVGGSLSVRSSFSSTMSAKDPSLYWNMDSATLNPSAPSLSATTDRSGDSLDGSTFFFNGSTSIFLSSSPSLDPTGGFKGFSSSNAYWELGDADSSVGGSGGYISDLVNPKTGWGSDVGSLSMWFRIPSDKTGANDANTGKSVVFAGINASDFTSLPTSLYKTSVVIFYSESKLSFYLYENGTAAASFTTTSTFNDNSWHHLVASWDNASGNVAAFHVDGGSLAGATKSYTGQSFYDLATDFTFDTRLNVGQGEFGQTAFNGFIDELAIWEHKALTAADARDLFFAGLGGPLSNDTDADNANETLTWLESDMDKAGLGSFSSKLTVVDNSGGFDFNGAGVTAGNYTFTYKAIDSTSAKSADATITIKVNGAPVGVNDTGYSIALNNTLNIDASSGVLANDSDPNNDTLSAFLASNPSEGTLSFNSDGSFTYVAPASITSTTQTFTYKVSDGSLEAGPYTATIIVSNDAPPVITQGTAVSVTMSENGSPTAWAAPTVAATDADSIASQLTWTVHGNPSNGNATVSGTGSSPSVFTYVPTTDFSGSDSFVVKVTDNSSLTDTITINVTIQDVLSPPVITQGAGPLSVTMSEDGAPTAWSAPTLAATDADTASGSLTWSVKTAASNGTATVSGTGSSPSTFTYAPTANWNGSDSFVVQVSDGSVADEITVNVTVSAVTDVPVITQGAGPLSVTMSEDGSPTAWAAPTLGATHGDSATLNWSVKTAASNGTATVSGTGASPGTFTYAPTANWNGSDSFVVQVSDGTATDEITVNVTVGAIADTPVITQGAGPLSVTMSEDGTPTAWAAPALGATDADTGDTLTWSVKTAATNGTAAVSGTGASPGTFTYVPTADFNGSDSFVVQVSDGNATDEITVNVTVSGIADTPVIMQGAGPLSVTMSEDGSPTGWAAPSLAATDADTGDTLTWSVKTAASNGTATVSGTGTSPSAFTYAPAANWNGSDSFVVQVSDGNATDEITVNVTVSALADTPVITQGAGPLSVTMSEDGSPTAWAAPNLAATDGDTGDTLTWSVKTAALNGTATVSGTGASPGTFTYTPTADFNGSDSFVVQVSDGNATDEITVNVAVNGIADTPVITQGAGPLSVTMSEDGTPTAWAAPALGATDADTGDTLTWSVKTVATNGTATVSGTGASPGTFTYVPTADFNGSDSFVVQVSDGNATDEITVNVTVSGIADTPVITQGSGPLSVTMSEDGSPTAWAAPTLGATDGDMGDTLTWSVKTAASNGTATVSGTGASPSSFNYVPAANWNGSDSFVVHVSDGNATDEITVNVTVSALADTPVITQGAGPLSVTMSEDGSPTAWAAPNLAATDGDTGDTLTWSIKTAASNGTATVSGTGASPGTFTYTPTADFNGSDSFVVQVSDGNATDEITVNVTVSGVADTPVITQGAGPLSVTMSEDGSPTGWTAPTLAATDADTGDTLTWSVKTAATNGTAAVSGTGASPGTFTYAPAADFNGSDSFVVQVSDGNATDEITVNVTVSAVNDVPVLAALHGGAMAYQEGGGNATLDVDANVTDVDSPDFNSGVLAVTITSGKDAAEDYLSVADANVTATASDAATATTYAGGWAAGDAGGSGLGAWAMTNNNDGTSLFAGSFIGDSTEGSAGNVNLSGKSFGLYANPTSASVNADRTFDSALAVGSTFSIKLAVNFRNGDKGIDLHGTGGNSQKLWNFNVGQNSSSDDYYYEDKVNAPGTKTSLDLSYQADSLFTLLFEQKAGNVVGVTIVRQTAAKGIEVPLFDKEFSLGTTVNGFGLYVSGTTNGDKENNFYANSIRVAPETAAGALVGLSGSNLTFDGTTVGTHSTPTAGQDLSVTFNDKATPMVASAVLRQVAYRNADEDNPTPGSRVVSFTISDGDGGTSSAANVTVTVTGVNDVPVFTSTAVTFANSGAAYSYVVTASDPDGNATLALTAPTKPSWLTFTDSGQGSGSLSGTPGDSDLGTPSVSLRATDSNGTYVDQNFTLTVTPSNYLPVIANSGSDAGTAVAVSMNEDNASSFSLTGLTASDSDDSNATLAWAIDTNAGQGTATVAGTGTTPTTLTYVPNANYNGADSFVLKVTDARGGTDSLTVNVTVNAVNDAPVINDGNATLALTANEENATTFSTALLTAADVDTATTSLTWSVKTAATNGTAATSGTGASPTTLTYQGNLNFVGADSFVVQVSDGALTDEITVNVTVNAVNDAPVITVGGADVNATTASVKEDNGSSFALAAAVAASDVDDANSSLTWSLKTAATNGIATVSGTGASPTVTYVPTADYNGSDSFALQVADDDNLTDEITVNVAVQNVNDPPHFTSTAVTEAVQFQAYSYSVTTSDPDGNGTVMLSATTKPTWLTLTALGGGMATLAGTPGQGDVGSVVITLSATDGNVTVAQTFTLVVDDVNDPPVIAQGLELNATVKEDNASSWSAPVLTATDEDDANSSLVWSLDSNATNGTATVTGTGAFPTNFTYVPNSDFNGTDLFRVKVSDSNSSDVITVNVTVFSVNDPPIIIQGADVNATVAELRSANATVSWTAPELNATDVDHNASVLVWSLKTSPTWGNAVVSGTGSTPTTLSYAPNLLFNGTDSFVAQVTDGNNTDEVKVTVVVTGLNDPPVIGQGTEVNASMDGNGFPNPWNPPALTATDPEGDTLTWSAYYAVPSDANGTASVSGTGSSPGIFAYAPNSGFGGTDLFKVKVSDGNLTDELDVRVTVSAQADPFNKYSLQAPLVYALENNATDWLLTGGAHTNAGDPPLLLFRDNVYVFENNGSGSRRLYVGTSPGVPYAGTEVWGNGAYSPDEYLVFTPTVTTPSLLYYYDVNNSSQAFSALSIRSHVEKSLFAADANASDAFGGALSLFGDRLAVGASQENSKAGAVYLYDRNDSAFPQTAKLVPADAAANDWFGASVALGQEFLVAGAPNDLDFNGSAYVFNRESNGNWNEKQKLTVSAVTSIDAFGFAVAVSGDRLVVSAIQPVSGKGAVYVFGKDANGTWSQEAMLTAADGANTDQFGASVAMEGDYVVVGAPKADVSGTDGGAAYVFKRDANGTWSQEAKLAPSVGHSPGDEFGTSVAVSGDVVLVGAKLGDGNGADSGSAYAFRRSTAGAWGQEARLDPPASGSSQGFGTSVSLSGSLAVVGAPTAGTGGQAHVFRDEANSTSWTHRASLERSSAASGDALGLSVAIGGGYAMAGSVGDDRNETDGGSVVLFANPAWQSFSNPALPPILTQKGSLLVIMNEDGTWPATELNATHPFSSSLTWSVSAAASDGNVTLTGTGGVPAWSYKPTINFAGSDSFVLSVADGNKSDKITVNVTVSPQPDPPVFTSTPATTGEETTAYSYSVAASDPDAGASVAVFIPTANPLPSWLSFTPGPSGSGTGTLSGTPIIGQQGSYAITLKATDETGLSTEQTFTINVAAINYPPVLKVGGADTNATTIVMSEDGSPTAWAAPSIQATDGNGHVLTWTLQTPPSNGVATVAGTGAAPTTLAYVPNAHFHGSDSFVIRASDGQGKHDDLTVNITMEPVNDVPVITSTPASNTANEGVIYTYSITATDADAGDVITLTLGGLPSWLAFTDNGGGSATLTGTPKWSDYATYAMTLTAADSAGATNLQGVILSVIPNNYPPVITQGAQVNASMSEDGSPTAWAAPTVVATDQDSDVSTLVWDLKTVPANGTATVSGSGASPQTFTYAPKLNFNGSDSFVIRVRDSNDLNASDEITVNLSVTPENDPPSFTSSPPLFGLRLNPYSYSVRTSDPDGLTGVMVSPAATLPSWLTLTPLGDGNATLSGTPTASDVGIQNVSLLVTDPSGATDQQVFAINVIGENQAPVITQGTDLNVTMDEDGSPLAWSAPELNATDGDGHTLTWSLGAAPSSGVVTVSGSGPKPLVFTYVPNKDFNGTDSFGVRVTDSISTDEIMVRVSVNPQPDSPAFSSSPVLIATENVAYLYEINATDPDGVTGLFFAQPSNLPDWLTFTDKGQGSATLSGTPQLSDEGNFSVGLTVSDPTGRSADQNFTLEAKVPNHPPVIVQGTELNATMSEDGTPVAWTAPTLTATDLETPAALTWSVVTQAKEGNATVTGTGTTPTLTYVPKANFNGSDQFVLRVTDITANGVGPRSDEITVNVTVTPEADDPTFVSTPVTDVTDEEDYVYKMLATDPDGNHTIKLSVDGTLPPWLSSFTDDGNGTATLRGRATPGDGSTAGTSYFIKLNASDDRNVSVTQSFFLNVKIRNYPPIFTPAGPLAITMNEDSELVGWTVPSVSAADPDPNGAHGQAQPLTWSVGTHPANGVAEVSGTGASPTTFVYTPNANQFGSDSFQVRVFDGNRSSDLTVNVTLLPRPDPPAFTSSATANARAGKSFSHEVVSVDPDGGDLTLRDFGRPDWMSITDANASDGKATLSGTPPQSVVGKSIPITFVAIDPTGRIAFQTLVLAVGPGNIAPVITQGAEVNATMSEDGLPIAWKSPELNATDSDGDVVRWSLLPGNGPSHGVATVEGNGSSPAKLLYVPEGNFTGEDSFVAQAGDGEENVTVTVKVTVTPVADAPAILGEPPLTARENVLYSYDFNVTDADAGDILAHAFVEAPSWLALNDLGHGVLRLSGIPPVAGRGSTEVSFKTTDSTGLSATRSFVLTVADGVPPVISLKGGSTLQVPPGETFVEPGYSAADDADGDLTAKVTVSGSVDVSRSGTYVLTYAVTDQAGNAAAPVTRLVHVPEPAAAPKVQWAAGPATPAELMAVATGADDSVYSIGSFSGVVSFGSQTLQSQGRSDIYLSRRGSDGSLSWATRFGGVDDDFGADVALAPDGSAYLSGSFRGAAYFGSTLLTSQGSADAFLVKVDSQGAVLWATSLGGTGDDFGSGLALASDGSILWTGGFIDAVTIGSSSLTSAGGVDVFVVKIRPDGALSWAKSAGGSGEDRVSDVAADPVGGSYVGGVVSNQAPGDVFLLRYDSSGSLSWAARGGGVSADSLSSLAADSSGAYLAGRFENAATFGTLNLVSAGASDAYLVKYSPEGSPLWAKAYGGTGADYGESVSLDGFGNPALLGHFSDSFIPAGQPLASEGDYDLFLVKASAFSGTPVLARSLGSVVREEARDLSVGSDGSLYLAGRYVGTSAKLDDKDLTTTGSYGTFVTKLGAPRGFPVLSDLAAQELVAGASFAKELNATLVSGLPPKLLLRKAPNWLTLEDRGNGTALLAGAPPPGIGGQYSVIVRATDGEGGTTDRSYVLTVTNSQSVSAAGEPETLWLQPGQGGEFANGVAPSGDGGYYVVGAFSGSTRIGGILLNAVGRSDSFVAKFTADGTPSWVNRFGGLDQDYAYAVRVGPSGAAYVAGYFRGTGTFGSSVLQSAGGYDAYLLRIEPEGQLTWAVRAGGTEDDYAKAVLAPDDSALYLAGHFRGAATFGSSALASSGRDDAFLARVNAADGAFQWARFMGGSGSDRAYALTDDGEGGVVAAGRFEETAYFGQHSLISSGYGDAFAARFDASGACLFASRAGGMGEDEARGVARSASGDYFLGGHFRVSATFGGHALASKGGSDVFLAKLAPLGGFSSVTSFGGAWTDELLDLGLDPKGRPVLAGSFRGSVSFGENSYVSKGDSDAFVAKYDDANASFLWTKTGGGKGPDAARAIAVDALTNRICLAGYASPGAVFDGYQTGTADSSRRSLLVADVGYREGDVSFTSLPLRFVTGGSSYLYAFTSGKWGTEKPLVSLNKGPDWLKVKDNGDGSGTLSGIAPPGATGSHEVVLRASDGASLSSSQSFSLVVGSNNGSPVIVASPPTTATPLRTYSFDITAFDPDGDAVAIYAASLPNWLKLERRGRGSATVSGIPTSGAGETVTIVIVATDGKNESRLTYDLTLSSAWWAAAESLGAANWRRNWFGHFSLTATSWTYHEHFGWVFAQGDRSDSVWFWVDGRGWFWTDSARWDASKGEGYLYRMDEASWLYFRHNGALDKAKLYRYSTSEWLPLLTEGK